MEVKNKKINKIFFFSLISIISIVVIINIFNNYDIKFQKEKWFTTDKTTKYRMSMNLKNRNFLINKNKKEIFMLLGEPNNKNNNTYEYKINQPLGFKDTLTIIFENNKVNKVNISD